MKAVLSVSDMRTSDGETIKSGVSGRELMRRAAEGIFRAVDWREPVAVVCGSGNNGGDGYALAQHLHKSGIACRIFRVGERVSPDGGGYLSECIDMGIDVEFFAPGCELSGYSTVVDCIFGTGFSSVPRGIFAQAVRCINESGAYVVSADINSGLDGDSGLYELCVRSDLTVSVGAYKPGHFLGSAKDVIGSVVNADIGIIPCTDAYWLAEAEDFCGVFPKRKNNSHKGTYGSTAIIGGCERYSGAVKLASAAQSALRSGCGLSRLAVPECIAHAVTPYLLESTLFPLSSAGGYISFCRAELDECCRGLSSAAFGMGLGQGGDNKELLEYLLYSLSIPLIIDADGLNTLAQADKSMLKKTACRVILTPHPGEFSRLCGVETEQLLRAPIKYASEFAREYGVIVLLKGACTIITDGARVCIVDRGHPGMATAGSGDVLSGILAGLSAFCPDVYLAACAGAYINGAAAQEALCEINEYSMTSSDTVRFIPRAVSDIIMKGGM